MKGDQTALLDGLVRYGAQLFFPFLRGPSVVIRLGFGRITGFPEKSGVLRML